MLLGNESTSPYCTGPNWERLPGCFLSLRGDAMSIDPPDSDPPPKWARTLVAAANARNRIREAPGVYTMDELTAAWVGSNGCCAVSGRAFDFQIFGDGQAKRPFAPSLDRIDCNQGYNRRNVRLVLSIANFAMNAWGLEPLQELSTAMHCFQGSQPASAGGAPQDSDLDENAAIGDELIETPLGVVALPLRNDLHQPLLRLLREGARSSRDLEDALAEDFHITRGMRAVRLLNGTPVWRNQVAWTLVDLGTNPRGTGQIERIASTEAPDGGTMGIYRLAGTPSLG